MDGFFLKFCEYVGHGINYRWFNFGGNPAGILDSGSLCNFRYHCVKGGIREPLAKRRWWRHLANSIALAEVPASYDCFLVFVSKHHIRGVHSPSAQGISLSLLKLHRNPTNTLCFKVRPYAQTHVQKSYRTTYLTRLINWLFAQSRLLTVLNDLDAISLSVTRVDQSKFQKRCKLGSPKFHRQLPDKLLNSKKTILSKDVKWEGGLGKFVIFSQ